jgi:hypothetical protein
VRTDGEARSAFDRTAGRKPNGAAGPASAFRPAEMCLTPAQWAAREIPPTDHLLGELLSTTCRVVIVADTGLGKTMFAVANAFAMWLGCGFLRWRGQRRARVLFIDGEMPRDLMKERILMACAWFGVEPPDEGLYFLSREDVEEMPPFDMEEGQKWLDAFIEAIGGVDFIILDNFMCLCAGDLRDEESWQALKPYVLSLTRRRIGQLWLHHVGHDKSRGYGTKTKEWQMDLVMLGEAVEAPGADVAFKLTFPKARRRSPSNRGDFETVQVELREGQWSTTTASEGTKKTRPLSPAAAIALEQLNRAVAECGETMPAATNSPRNRKGVKVEAWRERCIHAGISSGDSDSAQRQAFNPTVELSRWRAGAPGGRLGPRLGGPVARTTRRG